MDDTKTKLGKLNEPKNFTSLLTGLLDNTTFYIRPYAKYKYGTVYGAEKSITTFETGKPIITTKEVTSIAINKATCGGSVYNEGHLTVSARGVCWNITDNPTLDNSTGHTTDGSGTGCFTSNITGLTKNTTYYVAAYATNEEGTAYGQERTFTTPPTHCGQLTIDYHGQTYHTVKIGDQCWMKENLNYQTGNSWCYDNNSDNCGIYGRLYDWATIMNGASSSNEVPSGVQGICPDGWNIPSDAEWDILADYLGGNGVAGGRMKETGTTHWNSPNTGATNESGFTALPGGYRSPTWDFNYLGNHGRWWSATEGTKDDAWSLRLYYSDAKVNRYSTNKGIGFSVRCLRD